MKTLPAILLTVAIAVPLTWVAARKINNHSHTAAAPEAKTMAARKLLYYQSAMHPWIKADKPGRCTICGMELTPVYEGDAGLDAAGGDVIPLTRGMIQVMSVETAPVQRRSVAKTLAVAGVLDENRTRHRVLSAYVPGRIQKLYLNFVGAEVQAGEPLADFYSPNLLQAEREYRTLAGDLRAATAIRLQQMGLTSAQIQELEKKPADRLTTQILAPIGGTVVAQNVYEGQYVQEGENLFEIADFSTMWFQFKAYEQDLPWIKLGLKVEVTTPSVPAKSFTGNITFIDPNFDETTRSTKVRVELENPVVEGRRLLLHRLYADGRVHLDAPEALAVPRSAIIETGPQAVVYVEQGNRTFARRAIKIGRRGDDLVEVVSGIEAGEKVVINGNLLLDSQAEMNRAFSPKMHDETAALASSVELSEQEQQAIAALLSLNESLSGALAKDDLSAFNTAGKTVMDQTEKAAEAFKGRDELKDILTHLTEARHVHNAADLASARKVFHPFANASAKTFELLRNARGMPAFQVFECPMVDKAIAGVPKRGRWVQAPGRSIGNPYFGSQMLDCGQRIIPEGAL